MNQVSVAVIVVLAVGFVLLATFQVVQIWTEGGPRLFVWPRLRHGYEVAPATRLAVTPWYMVLFLCLAQALIIVVFSHDLLGQPQESYAPWLVAALVSLVVIHLVDHVRSVIAAVLSMLVLAALAGVLFYWSGSWIVFLVFAPFLLWAVNGVRAVHADRTMG
jgi:hypothetical protein